MRLSLHGDVQTKLVANGFPPRFYKISTVNGNFFPSFVVISVTLCNGKGVETAESQ